MTIVKYKGQFTLSDGTYTSMNINKISYETNMHHHDYNQDSSRGSQRPYKGGVCKISKKGGNRPKQKGGGVKLYWGD